MGEVEVALRAIADLGREAIACIKRRRTIIMKPVGIIGGGLGGLSAACVLAARGYKVILFERNHWLGGKAAQLRGDGFRFDMGPTIVTVPSVLRRIFARSGRAHGRLSRAR